MQKGVFRAALGKRDAGLHQKHVPAFLDRHLFLECAVSVDLAV